MIQLLWFPFWVMKVRTLSFYSNYQIHQMLNHEQTYPGLHILAKMKGKRTVVSAPSPRHVCPNETVAGTYCSILFETRKIRDTYNGCTANMAGPDIDFPQKIALYKPRCRGVSFFYLCTSFRPRLRLIGSALQSSVSQTNKRNSKRFDHTNPSVFNIFNIRKKNNFSIKQAYFLINLLSVIFRYLKSQKA